MNPLVEICTHCWHYDRLLCYHLSAFVIFPPQSCQLRVTICYCEEDGHTVEVLKFFESLAPKNIQWRWLPLAREKLLRRAIGRNIVATETDADYVMFSDCDYLMGDGMIDSFLSFAQAAGESARLWFPRRVKASRTHGIGDEAVEAVRSPQVIWINPKDCIRMFLDRAIGGAQYVPGRIAREYGYCRDSRRYQKPSRFWRRTFEDSRYRLTIGRRRGIGLPLPNVFRIRHGDRGRDNPGIRL